MRRLTVISLLVALTICAGASASSSSTTTPTSVTTQLALAHIAPAKYATDLARAKADGYPIITRMIPNMGYHFLNPKVKGFDLRTPPILVYVHRGAPCQLGALEWVSPTMPTTPPIDGRAH